MVLETIRALHTDGILFSGLSRAARANELVVEDLEKAYFNYHGSQVGEEWMPYGEYLVSGLLDSGEAYSSEVDIQLRGKYPAIENISYIPDITVMTLGLAFVISDYQKNGTLSEFADWILDVYSNGGWPCGVTNDFSNLALCPMTDIE